MDDRAQVWKEGMVAGTLGAAGVAAWFLLVDLLAGTPLSTPDLLGRTLLSILGREVHAAFAVNVLAYTAFHLAAFLAVGSLVSWIVAISERSPGALAGLLMFFVVSETGFHGLTLLLGTGSEVGRLAWYHVGAANLLASVLMGGYLWRRHPEVVARAEAALSARV